MSTYHQIPVIKLWHVLLVPLQGDLTDEGAAQLSSEVLERLHSEDASGLVIDITGLWMVDSHLCATLSRLAAAAALMGTRTVVSGMKPNIALTLETMGIGLAGIRTTLSLESALALLGVRAQADAVHDATGDEKFTSTSSLDSPTADADSKA